MSILTGQVPSDLKIAKVIPIYKKGNKNQSSNYRPISMLNILSKILEKIIFSRMLSFLDKYKILNKHQFGFRKNHSTATALINALDNVYEHLDRGEDVIGVYLDIQKAFDCINHDILLDKLKAYGIRGTAWEWFKNYLGNRKQFVSLMGYKSTNHAINYGVPQGSVLGPLLFLIYINDIQNANNTAFLNLFADDTSLFVFDKDVNNLFATCNNVLESINKWFIANKLKLSLDKCVYTYFQRTKNKKSMTSHKLYLNGAELQRVENSKYLGIFIDENLTWHTHIQYIISKLLKFCSIFYKLRSIIPHQILKTLYFSLVHPHLSYCVEIYANTYNKYLDPLIKLNNKILRILQNQKINYPVKKMYTLYNCMPVPQLHEYSILLLMHKFNYNKEQLPLIFQVYFTENFLVHRHDTRQVSLFHLNRTNSTHGQRSIKFKGCKLWNNLPEIIRLNRGMFTFKKKLKIYLMIDIIE